MSEHVLGEAATEFVDTLQPPFDPSTDAVFDSAKAWIETCCRSHKQCRIRGWSGPPLLPTRVIDVGVRDAPTVRLHVSASGEVGEYACLSYCWGGDQFKTVSKALEEMKTQIPMHRLSSTVTDAIEAIRRLGLRFLWVDALCIVQDSDEDKTQEISRMGGIYKSATVTIAAATARAASEGFLRTPWSAPRSAAVRLRLPNDDIGIVRLTISDFFSLGQSRRWQDHPLDTRGWCLQELLLSPRLLVFSRFNVEQQCQLGMKTAGDGPFGTGQPGTVQFEFRLPPGIFGKDTIRNLLNKLGRASIRMVLYERKTLWTYIVEHFSARELSDPEDRLPALAGIAGELQKYWGDKYVFGMWEKLLPWTLAWVVVDRDIHRRLSLAPTWSWVSVGSRVKFDLCNSPALIDVACETSVEGGMAQSSPSFPRLTVKGTLIHPTDSRPPESLLVWPDLNEPFSGEEWSYLVIDCETSFWPGVPGVKETTNRYLVLRRVDDGVYARVGVAVHRHVQHALLKDDAPWLKLSKKPRVRIQLV